MFTTIYALQWLDQGLIYIGKSTNVNARINSHLHKLSTSTHYNSKLQNCYNANGEPTILVLDTCLSTEAVLRERYWIDEFNSESEGLNQIGESVNSNTALVSHVFTSKAESTNCKHILVGPDDTIYYFDNIRKFCSTMPILKDNLITRSIEVGKVLRGERNHAFGYRKYAGTDTYILDKEVFYDILKDGVLLERTSNLAEFCRNNIELQDAWYNNANSLRAVASGTRKKVKGYTCFKV